MKLRKRHRLRRKEINALAEELRVSFGCDVFDIEDTVDRASAPDYEVILVNGESLAFVIDGRSALTVKGVMKYKATKAFVVVDMGAVPYVVNGADVMAPGIVDADAGIGQDDMIWVKDQRNHKPLAIGVALLPGPEMVSSKKGKAVKTLHFFGDGLWELEQ